MTEEINLMIKKGTRVLFGPVLAPEAFHSLYEKLKPYGVVVFNQNVPIEQCDFFKVRCSSNDPSIPFMINALRELGWEPYVGYVPQQLRKTHYSWSVSRTYEKNELEQVEYFSVVTWGDYKISGLVERRGKRYCAEAEIAKWKLRHGSVEGFLNYFVNTPLKISMEAELKGLLFHRLEWDEPELVKHDYWEIDTRNIMPACQTPVVFKDNQMYYEEGNYSLEELCFKRRAVEKMGDFDVAWGRESIGLKIPAWGNHMLIVSQKFRKFALKHKLNALFVPVRLVD